MRGVIHVTRGAAGTDPDGAVRRIDTDALHQRQIDDEAVVDAAKARAVVAAAANRDQEALLAAEVDGRDHIRRVDTAGDQARPLVDHPVVDSARVFVVWDILRYQVPANLSPE